jgi:hypothetical protein
MQVRKGDKRRVVVGEGSKSAAYPVISITHFLHQTFSYPLPILLLDHF